MSEESVDMADLVIRRMQPVELRTDSALIEGVLVVPANAAGLVVFAYASGSGRFNARNRALAAMLEHSGFATLLLDLLTRREEAIDRRTMEYRFDIERLASRVIAAVDWAGGDRRVAALPIACFGASTGAAAALIGAAERPDLVRAVIARGGRLDLAGDWLPRVQAPTLLIVGGADPEAIDCNRAAMRRMSVAPRLQIVPGATRMLEEPGAPERVSELAVAWCRTYLAGPRASRLRETG